MKESATHMETEVQHSASTIELLLLSSSVAYLLYLIFFSLTPYIWSSNPVPPVEEFTSWARLHVKEHDGAEVYVLYAFMFLQIGAVTGAAVLFRFLHRSLTRYAILLTLLVLSSAFLFSVGFNPPMSSLVTKTATVLAWQIAAACTGVAVILALLYYLRSVFDRAVPWLAAIILVPVCFIATQPTSWTDSSYIFTPALRILNGESISQIYFQYDLLLSLVAALWMKLKIDVEYFQVLAQAMFYLFIMAVFLFSRRFFYDKTLPLFLFVSLTVMKMYALDQEPTAILQVTPLRLELWLPLLMLVYFKGPRHWMCGLYCGILLVLHRNFGLIYAAAYCQLVLTILLLEYHSTGADGRLTVRKGLDSLKKHLIQFRYSLSLLVAGVILNRLFFGGINTGNASLYRKIGIGFLKITPNSFYWYVFILAGVGFASLFRYRDKMSKQYLYAGFMLLFLAIGNSIYFFGRSHESNIINISAILLLLFFFIMDMIGKYDFSMNLPDRIRRGGVKFAAVACIMLISVYYGNKIYSVVGLQAENAGKHQNIYPPDFRNEFFLRNLETVREVTGNSKKVYFLTFNDFKYCYFGGYAPVGYFSPFQSWLLQKDLTLFLSDLVAKGYYLVMEETRFVEEILPLIGCNKFLNKNGVFVMWKE